MKAHRETRIRDGTTTNKADFFSPAGQAALDTRRQQSSHLDDQAGPPMAGSSKRIVNGGPAPNSGRGLVFQHYEPKGKNKKDGDGDVEMS